MARVQGVPLTLVESLIHDLVKAGMVFRTDEPQGLVLARPPESISVAEVLRVVQHQPHNGPQSFSVGTDVMSQVLMRRDAAVEAALEGLTLRSLVKEQADASDQEQGNTFESASEGSDMSLAPPAMEEIGFPKPLQR